MTALTGRIQEAGTEVVKAKAGAGRLTHRNVPPLDSHVVSLSGAVLPVGLSELSAADFPLVPLPHLVFCQPAVQLVLVQLD